MDAMGVPGNLLPLVIALEVLGGAAQQWLAVTRIAAVLFAGFSVVSAAIFHADFSDQNQMIHFMKNVSIAGGFTISLSTVQEPTLWMRLIPSRHQR